MKNILLSLLVFVVSIPFYGQDTDSLWRLWKNPSLHDSLRISALYNYSQLAFNVNTYPDSVLYYHGIVYNKAKELNNQEFLVKGALNLATAKIAKGEYTDEVTQLLQESLTLSRQLNEAEPLIKNLRLLGIIYKVRGYPQKARPYTEEALRIIEEEPPTDAISTLKIGLLADMAAFEQVEGNHLKAIEANKLTVQEITNSGKHLQTLSAVYYNLALNYDGLGMLKEAIDHLQLARDNSLKYQDQRIYTASIERLVQIFRTLKDYKTAERLITEGLAISDSLGFHNVKMLLINQKARVLSDQGHYESALKNYQKVLAYRKENANLDGELFTLIGIGTTRYRMGALDDAEKLFLHVLDRIHESQSPYTIVKAPALLLLGKIHADSQRWASAKIYANEAYDIALEINNKNLQKDVTELLTKIYKHYGNTDLALTMMERFTLLKDSLNTQEMGYALLQNQMQFEFDKQIVADSVQNAALLNEQKLKAKQKEQTSYFYLGILVLSLLFLLLLWNRFTTTKKQKSELDQAYAQLNAANDSLKELDASKSRFFTNISHEFRTPLTVIKGMTERLKSDSKAKRLIQRNADQLLQLINQILDLRKLEAGQLSPQYIQGDIVKYLRYLVESFHSLANDNGITLEFKTKSPSLLLDFDPDKILTITSNIISNALKFTPENGSVCLSVQDTDESYEFTITDTGPGIEKDKLPFLFDRFYQVDGSVSRTGEGTGIGLALVKELAELMDGSVMVESEVDKGTAFTVKLPRTNNAVLQDAPTVELKAVKENYKPTSLPESNSENQSELPHLLLVEDNPDVMEYLSTFLQESYRLSFAKDGLQGIKMALEMVPDLLISDVMMPKKNGFELCHALKSDERTSHIPIILLTAKADADAQLNGLLQGADDYLIKPFDRRELEIRLKNILANRMRLQARYSAIDQLEPTTDKAVLQEDAFVLKLRQIIQEHMGNENFGVPQLCREAAMSRTQLHNKLKSLTSRSTSQFIRDVRMNKAVDLLRNSQLNISEIALEVGIGNLSYFSRIFSNETGHSPNRYREIMTSEQ